MVKQLFTMFEDRRFPDRLNRVIVTDATRGPDLRMGSLTARAPILQKVGRISLFARLTVLAAGALLLANCSGGLTGRIDPRYGVAASARVVEPGEPVPKGGGHYRVGKPYTVAGRTYVPEENPNYEAVGMASWYGDDFHGRYTANGEVFDMNSISAAHKTMPLPSYARVTNLRNHKSIIVRVNDRGPYAANRVIDVSVKTAKLLGFYGQGLAKVKVEYVGRAPIAGSDDRMLMATLRDGASPSPQQPVKVASNGNFAAVGSDKPTPAAKGAALTYFDARPMTETMTRPLTRTMTEVPRPPSRPYQMASAGNINVPAPVAGRPPPPELTASPQPATTPVSAVATTRYDSQAGFMSGRGLY
jgi:rare lipoprotein A